jgi:hypothetical protein
MTMTITRRQTLFTGAAAVALAALGQSVVPARAANDLEELSK